MNTQHYKFTFFLFVSLFAVIFTACQDEVDIDLDDPEQLLVVEGQISDIDSVQWVKLSYTTDYFDDNEPNYTVEQNALVVLYQNDIVLDTMDFNTATNQFEWNGQGAAGNTYNIYIRTEDGTEYESFDEILTTVSPIDSLYYDYESVFLDFEGYQIKIKTYEPAPEGDYYQWKVYVNGQYLNTAEDLSISSDENVLDGELDFSAYFMSQEDYDDFSAENTTDVFVRVEQIKITKTNFEYLNILADQASGGGFIFSSPPAQIRGNIVEKGTDTYAVGFFQAVSIDDATVQLFPE